MLRSAGFEIVNHPEEEVYICHKAALNDLRPPAYAPRGLASDSPQT
jgi:hypothetical protein